jgi:hypothetical protein
MPTWVPVLHPVCRGRFTGNRIEAQSKYRLAHEKKLPRQTFQALRTVQCLSGSAVAQMPVDMPDTFEDHRQGPREVEVIIHGIAEPEPQTAVAFAHLRWRRGALAKTGKKAL